MIIASIRSSSDDKDNNKDGFWEVADGCGVGAFRTPSDMATRFRPFKTPSFPDPTHQWKYI
jgi:hypothetical protein